ncbi:MAG: CoA transferase [Deltaproteobacteria bacterium]|nr:CoA transferase [Deltaproteobacteria bacterium]
MQIFDGIKVADFSWVIVGPRSTQYLAEHGATVVRIESMTHPETLRTGGPFVDFQTGINRTGFYARYNTNKYGASLNLGHTKGIEIAKRFVEWADIVAESFVPGKMKAWGLDYEELVKIRPDIIMLSACNQGQSGPHASQPGYGVQLASLSGFTHMTGWSDRAPAGIYGAYTDFVSPHFIAAVLAAALDFRCRTGKGQYIDCSQLECGMQFLSPAILDYTANGRVRERNGNRYPDAAPHNAYRCQGDDLWCAIAVFSDDEWQSFCNAISNPPWCKEERFSTLTSRKENEEALDRLVESWTLEHTVEEAVRVLQAAGIAAGMVAKGEDLYKDPQFKHRNLFQELPHAEMGTQTWEGPPFIFSKTPTRLHKAAPCLGEDNYYVYTQLLGMNDEEFADLISQGVLD